MALDIRIGDRVKLTDETLGKIITPLSTGGFVIEEKETRLMREITEKDIIEVIRDGFTLFKVLKSIISFFKNFFSKRQA